MSNFKKFISMSAVAVLGVTNLLTPLSYASAATKYDLLTESDLKQRALSFMMPDHNVSLYAKTVANHYYLDYNGNAENVLGTTAQTDVTYDATGHLESNGFSRTGYTFDEWNRKSDGTGTGYVEGADVYNWTTASGQHINIYAIWDVNHYIIRYDLNDGEGTTSSGELGVRQPTSIAYDETGYIDNPSRTGYGFSGWNISGMDGEDHIVGGEASNAETASGVMGESFKNLNATDEAFVDFQAIWKANTDTQYVVYHKKQNLEDDGYTTYRIYTGAGTTDTTETPAVDTNEGFASPATQTKQIKADGSTEFVYQYSRNTYDLELNAGRGVALVAGTGTTNGVEGSTDDTTTITFKYGEPVELGYTLKQGYGTGAWSGSNNNMSSFTMPAGDISKTAYAEPTVYTITYNTRSGSVNPANPTSYTVESGDFTLTDPMRPNSTFAGWTGGVVGGTQLSAATTGVTITSGSIGNRSYSATWTCHSGFTLALDWSCIVNNDTPYTVRHFKLDLDGVPQYEEFVIQTGTTNDHVAPRPKTYEGFEAITPLNTAPTINGSGDTVVDIQYKRLSYDIDEDSENVSVDFSGAHDANAVEGKHLYGDTITITADPDDGYSFASWTIMSGEENITSSLLGANSTSQTTTFTMPASDITITANVSADEFHITYNWNGGTGTNPETYRVTTPTFSLAVPTRDTGSVFVGWSGTDTNGTAQYTVTITGGSLGDRSYEAIWTCRAGYHDGGENNCVNNTYTGHVFYNDGEHPAADDITFTYDVVGGLPAAPEQSGYDFAGWTIEGMSGGVTHYIGDIPVDEDGDYIYTGTIIEFMNLTTDNGGEVILTARWTPRDDTPYTVNHYWKVAGSNTYVLLGTDHLEGTTEDIVTFNPDLLKSRVGFAYSGGYVNSGSTTRPTEGAETSAIIDKKGGTVINLYYDRNRWTVSVSGDEHTSGYQGAGTYDYEENVSVNVTVDAGYHFAGWTATPAPSGS